MVNAEFISEDGLVTRAKVIHNFLVFSRATEYDVISAFSLKKKRGPTDDDFKELFIHTLHSLKPKFDPDGYQDLRPVQSPHLKIDLWAEQDEDPCNFYTLQKVQFDPMGTYAFCGMKEGVLFIVEVERGIVLLSRKIICTICKLFSCTSEVKYSVEFLSKVKPEKFYTDWTAEDVCIAPYMRRALATGFTESDAIEKHHAVLEEISNRICLLAAFGPYQVKVSAQLHCLKCDMHSSNNLCIFYGLSAQDPMNYFLFYTDYLKVLVEKAFLDTNGWFGTQVAELMNAQFDSAASTKLVKQCLELMALCSKHIRPILNSCLKACAAAKSSAFCREPSYPKEIIRVLLLKLCTLSSAFETFEKAFHPIGRLIMSGERADSNPFAHAPEAPENIAVLRNLRLHGLRFESVFEKFFHHDIPELSCMQHGGMSLVMFERL